MKVTQRQQNISGYFFFLKQNNENRDATLDKLWKSNNTQFWNSKYNIIFALTEFLLTQNFCNFIPAPQCQLEYYARHVRIFKLISVTIFKNCCI